MRYELTDFEWAAIRSFLPNKSRGIPRVDDRRVHGLLMAANVGGNMQRCEPFEKQAAEQTREHAHRQEEAGPAGDPAAPSGDSPPPGTMTWTCG